MTGVSTDLTELPRHDYYQTPTELIASIYVKGYGQAPQREAVNVDYHTDHVIIELPEITGAEARSFRFPLAGTIIPSESTERVLGTKIELRLVKAEPVQWPALISIGGPVRTVPLATRPTTNQATTAATPAAALDNLDPYTITRLAGGGSSATQVGGPSRQAGPKLRKNWDALVLDEDEDELKDPNAGGDAALQKFFNELYANGDENTKRAMIKSYTESGGTALSVDWNKVGQETTPVRPPDGMYEMKM